MTREWGSSMAMKFRFNDGAWTSDYVYNTIGESEQECEDMSGTDANTQMHKYKWWCHVCVAKNKGRIHSNSEHPVLEPEIKMTKNIEFGTKFIITWPFDHRGWLQLYSGTLYWWNVTTQLTLKIIEFEKVSLKNFWSRSCVNSKWIWLCDKNRLKFTNSSRIQ